jgi:GTP cyclohydrolase II
MLSKQRGDLSRDEVALLKNEFSKENIYVFLINQTAVAMIHGDLAGDAPFVRTHSQYFTVEILESLRCDCPYVQETASSIGWRKRASSVILKACQSPNTKHFRLRAEGIRNDYESDQCN